MQRFLVYWLLVVAVQWQNKFLPFASAAALQKSEQLMHCHDAHSHLHSLCSQNSSQILGFRHYYYDDDDDDNDDDKNDYFDYYCYNDNPNILYYRRHSNF